MGMDVLPTTSEIVESTEDTEYEPDMSLKAGKQSVLKVGNKYSIEDDINRLFEAIDIRASTKGLRLVHEGGRDSLRKKAMKRPMRIGSPQTSGIGIAEPVSLKQALRGLCISQASEMAAMKRLSKQASSSRASEAGTIKRLYREVVVDANASGLPLNEGNGNLVEISLVPEKITASTSEKEFEASQRAKDGVLPVHDHVVPLVTGFNSEIPQARSDGLASAGCSSDMHTSENLKEADGTASVSRKFSVETLIPQGQKNHLHSTCLPSSSSAVGLSSSSTCSSHLHSTCLPSSSSAVGLSSSSTCSSPRFMPIFRGKNFIRKKVKKDSSSSNSLNECNEKTDRSLDSGLINSDSRMCDCHAVSLRQEIMKASPHSRSTEFISNIVDSSPNNLDYISNCNKMKSVLSKVDEKSRSREKGEFSQSSKSSIGDYSSSVSTSEGSNLSGSSCSGTRPHMSRDLRWEAIRQSQKQYGGLSLKHFKLIKKLGCGDIGSIYLAELTGTNCLFALKVMDNEFLASRKKMSRARTEKEIMQMLDHPFLPTLYAHFVSDKFSCLVMEYCPGGDLHMSRQKQPGRCFSEQAARFYVAEVLLALEYLHMLGVIYRDLKPENILVREDGHIMLSDFDLSLRCTVNPILVQSSSPDTEQVKKTSSPCSESSCIDPFCLHPAWQVSCFTPRLLSVAVKSRKLRSDLASQVNPLPQLVVEPTSARSNSFVGTHEYLAPEMIKGEGHGSAVDWWTFGIFLFELLYGRTPFKGSGNEETLTNVVSRSLKFPSSPIVSIHARDLIRGLLIKEPENRLGSAKGAAEIRQHPFFEGLNWPLIRCSVPPELPKFCDVGIGVSSYNKDNTTKSKESRSTEEDNQLEMF